MTCACSFSSLVVLGRRSKVEGQVVSPPKSQELQPPPDTHLNFMYPPDPPSYEPPTEADTE